MVKSSLVAAILEFLWQILFNHALSTQQQPHNFQANIFKSNVRLFFYNSSPPDQSNSKPVKITPTKTNKSQDKPDEDFYDRRGAMLSARKRRKKPVVSDDEIIDPNENKNDVLQTPNKNLESIKDTPEVRRSPRKHASSRK